MYDNVIHEEVVLAYFDDLIWDDWNKGHVARHHVRIAEATAAVAEAAFMTKG